MNWKHRIALLPLLTLTLSIGCSQTSQEPVATTQTASQSDHADGDGHSHDGWWCGEHGIPEEQCTMCSSKAAAEFQKKGDWCKEHDRADSQCFICHPELEAQFAALYEAKYGEQPPKPIE